MASAKITIVPPSIKEFSRSSRTNFTFCFAYGSACLARKANLEHNFSHYSGLKYFGHMTDIWIKYGVVTTEDLFADLLEWSNLYLAGRLHKPVEIIRKPSSTELETALQLNFAIRSTCSFVNFTRFFQRSMNFTTQYQI
ncbi:hypothetical protein NQ317_018552 [Molorchus minor]|uniref:Phosphatidate cytidylyltransferase, mitochondrial n=1 Tax=Molorchus minor TaxID=1323400 RepID=A0ABQ9JXD3_9CUCU|nr:hypothetical protein NQ317_018552 [Molorchus minor]